MKIFNLRIAMQSVLLLLLMTAGVTKVFAQNEFVVDNIVYHPYNSTTAWVWGCNIGVTSLNVPSTVTYNNHTYTVTEIYQNAFYGNTTLTDVILPNTMTMIGEDAFKNCTSLTTVVLPEGLTTLNSGAFQGCSNLQYFGKRVGNAYISPNELPSTLETIYGHTFYSCSSLQSIRIPSSITEIQGNAFANCTNLEYVYVYGLTTPTLGSDVFSNTHSELNIYVPAASEGAYEAAANWSTYASSIKAMPAHEFLTYTFDTDNHTATVSGYLEGIAGNLEIPTAYHGFTVTAIEENAFYDTVEFTGCNGITSVTFPQYLTTIGTEAFRSCHNITTIDISQCFNLTETEDHAFYGCQSLTDIKWNKAFTTIENSAFGFCGFTTMEIPNTVTSIGYYAFEACELVSLTIPKSVSRIYDAFKYNHLQNVYCYGSVPPTIDANAFTDEETFNCTLHVPYGCNAMYETATGWEKFTNIVEMELNTLYYSYEESNHTATVVCYAGYPIGEVTIPETVTHNNETYTVTNIGEGAFRYAGSITKINLPSTIVAIDDYAFADCNDLTSLILPALTSNIGDYAFQGCTNLAEIIALEPIAPVVNEHSFDGLDNIPCYVSVDAFDSFVNSYYWNTNFTITTGGLTYDTDDTNHTAVLMGCSPNYIGAVTIPSSITSGGQSYSVVGIHNQVFMNQSYITTISIPASVEYILDNAFKNCQSLTAITVDAANANYKSVEGVLFNKAGTVLKVYPTGKTNASYEIPYGVTSVDENAFAYNVHLTSLHLPAALNMDDPTYSLTDIPNLTTITVDNGSSYYSTIDGVLVNKAETKLLYYPAGRTGSYTVPNSINTIGHFSFYNCNNLTGITIPNTVTTLEYGAFESCKGLTSVTLPNSITEVVGFIDCSNLKSVTLPENVTTISRNAFLRTDLRSLTLPSTVTSIGEYSLQCENLGEITCKAIDVPVTHFEAFGNVPTDIPVYVPAASVSAYQNATGWSQFTNIQAITDPAYNLVYSYDDNNMTATVEKDASYANFTGALVIPGTVQHNNMTYTVTEIADEAFAECHGLTSVVIPHTVETIGVGAFRVCEGITELTIGRNVTHIGNYAFEACTGLTTIHYYPVNCQTVGSYPIWRNCGDNAKTLDIKNCVQSIPNNAFYNLDGLGSVTIPSSVTSIGELAFADCDLTTVTIGSNVKTLGYKAFSSSGLTSVDLNNVETLGNSAFTSCANLATVTIRNSQQTISESCFENCTSLNNVHIPSGVRIIDKEAFKGCTSLTNLVFDNPFQGLLTTIGESAFESCGLTSVDIPSTVTTVETWAFYGNTNLTTVTIGTGMQYMGSNLFYNCTSLATVNYNATHCNTIASSFGSNTGGATKTLHIGNNVNYIPGNAFAGLNLASVTIPNGVTEIGEYAFYDCQSITDINIPNSVTIIGEAAFAGNQLATITLGSGLISIGEYAFGTDESEQYLQTVTSYNVTPPTIFENTFNAGDYQHATLKVLGATAEEAYEAHPVWTLFTIESLDGYYFTGATNSNWGLPANWSNNTVPTSDPLIQYIAGEENPDWNTDFCPNVIILVDATVDIPNAFANKLTIMGGSVVTVTNHNKLYLGNWGATYNAADASALVIKEGGSLWNSMDIQATAEKSIDHYTGTRNGWQFVSSPLMGEHFDDMYGYYAQPDEIENMLEGNYDLYLFDQTQYKTEWQNYKAHQADFEIRRGQGYLYANNADVTLKFAGTIEANMDESGMVWDKEVYLVCSDEQIEMPDPNDPNNMISDYSPYRGWNLVGNPFAGDAYLKDDYYVVDGYYEMSADGSAIEAVETYSGRAIPSCTGIFLQANRGDNVFFSLESPDQYYKASNNGSLQIALEQPATEPAERVGVSTSSTTFIDNAIVSFNEGSKLEKFVLFPNNARIYIPQNGKDYAIVSAEPRGEMPINFVAPKSGQFTISVRPEAVSMSYLHLIDNLTGADIDLLENPSYTFNAESTDYASRFKLVFATESSIRQ